MTRACCFLAVVLFGCVDFQDSNSAPSDVRSSDGDSSGDDGGSDTAGMGGGDSASAEDTGGKGNGLTPAGDYTQTGSFTPGNLDDAIEGSSGNTLYVDAWFPSSESGSEHRYYGWDSWGFTGDSYTDVEPDCSEPRPVMVHSHGNNSIRWEMFYLPEFLSTHGWIVAAPDHEGNTFYDNTEDFSVLVARRPIDIADTFDWLVRLSEDPESSLYGCVDEAAGYVVSGYSFGGYTAYATAGAWVNEGGAPAHDFGDERVWAVVTFAPWNAYGLLTTGTSEIVVPALTLGAEQDATVGTQYQNLHSRIESTPRVMGSVENAGHFSFTPIYCSSWGNGCGPYYMDPEEFVPTLQTSVLSTVEHFRGRSGAIEQLPQTIEALSWEVVE